VACPRPEADRSGRSAAAAPVSPTKNHGNRLNTERFASSIIKHEALIGTAVATLWYLAQMMSWVVNTVEISMRGYLKEGEWES